MHPRPSEVLLWVRHAASTMSALWSWWLRLEGPEEQVGGSIKRAGEHLGRHGWRHGRIELRPGRLTFWPESSVVVPGGRPFTIEVTRVDLLDERPEPWGLSELVGLDRQQLLLMHGADGRFHLRIDRDLVPRLRRELLAERTPE